MAIALLPLWGAALGAAGAELFLHGAPALLVVILWIVAGHFEILPRPWILGIVLAAFWFEALRHMDPAQVLTAAVAAHSVSRAGMIALAWVSRPGAEGLALASRLNTWRAIAAILIGVAGALLAGWRVGLVMLLGSYLILRLARLWCYKRRGGIDRAGLAVSQALLELFALICGARGF